ncbi:hypothetical protein FJY94_01765 [Candidatus Kaiserbacteria bacterium]|nr:hypothetical protein [Candidatus Kaiserbacteria bacterium]
MQANRIIAGLILWLGLPSLALAQASGSFRSGGIYDCNQNGAYAMSSGTLNAVTSGSGTYVPVNDSAVTQNTAGILVNTGTLVYKECVLRNVVNRMAENSLVGIGTKTWTAFGTMRDGRPMFPVDVYQEVLDRQSEVVLHAYENSSRNYFNNIHPAYRDQVRRTVLRGFLSSTSNRNAQTTCPYRGDLAAFLRGDPGTYSDEAMLAVSNPACNPLFAYEITRQRLERDLAYDTNEMMMRLNWSNGIYGVEQTDPTTLARRTNTPGILVHDVVAQTVTAGYRRQENANDIGQMVGGLFAGFGTQIMSTSGGFTGALQGSSGGQSYIGQMVQQSTNGLLASAVNVALTQLAAARQTELAFNQAISGLANVLLSARDALRSVETQCWALIISRVCTPGTMSTSTNPQTCKDGAGNTLRIATTTTASAVIITSQITPLASTTQADLVASNNALAQIDRLIVSVQDSTSQSTQQSALLELDRLVASGALHTPQDVSNARNRRDSTTLTLEALIAQTKSDWADSEDTSIGWCNVNNPAVLQMWATRWKI